MIWEKTGPAHDDCKLLDELWGPVVTNAGSTWYLGADTESNNTAEMTAMAETCLFSKAQGGTTPLTMVFDSRYAANATQGKQKKAESNLELAAVCNKLYAEEKKRRNVQLIWVRGHSGNKGNDRADLLAQWGKASGPHSRIPLRGETEERAKSRAELRKKIEELQKAEQKAKPSSTNQNNQNNQNNNMNITTTMKTVQTKMTATTAMWPCAASRARRPLRPRTRLIPEAIAAAHRAPALRRRQVPHLRVSQGKEQTVLGESALSRYSDLSLKAYSQSVRLARPLRY